MVDLCSPCAQSHPPVPAERAAHCISKRTRRSDMVNVASRGPVHRLWNQFCLGTNYEPVLYSWRPRRTAWTLRYDYAGRESTRRRSIRTIQFILISDLRSCSVSPQRKAWVPNGRAHRARPAVAIFRLEPGEHRVPGGPGMRGDNPLTRRMQPADTQVIAER